MPHRAACQPCMQQVINFILKTWFFIQISTGGLDLMDLQIRKCIWLLASMLITKSWGWKNWQEKEAIEKDYLLLRMKNTLSWDHYAMAANSQLQATEQNC